MVYSLEERKTNKQIIYNKYYYNDKGKAVAFEKRTINIKQSKEGTE